MTDETEGMLLVTHCMFMALLDSLGRAGLLDDEAMYGVHSKAEELLARLPPEWMSDGARAYASRVLSEGSKDYRGEPKVPDPKDG